MRHSKDIWNAFKESRLHGAKFCDIGEASIEHADLDAFLDVRCILQSSLVRGIDQLLALDRTNMGPAFGIDLGRHEVLHSLNLNST